MRDIYEVPAAAIVLTAHQELEHLVGTIHQNQFKPGLDQKWGYLVYAGLWWEPLRSDLDAYMDAVNAQVTGTIGLKLYKGSARVVTRESPNAVYDASLASFAESGGLFSQTASPGFIELWSLQSRHGAPAAHRARERLARRGAQRVAEGDVRQRLQGARLPRLEGRASGTCAPLRPRQARRHGRAGGSAVAAAPSCSRSGATAHSR